jgi:hypothetical protein
MSGQLQAPATLSTVKASPTYTHRTGCWVSFTAGLEILDKRKITYLCRESNQNFSVVQPDLRSTQTLVKPVAYLRSHRTPNVFTLFIYLVRRTYIS